MMDEKKFPSRRGPAEDGYRASGAERAPQARRERPVTAPGRNEEQKPGGKPPPEGSKGRKPQGSSS